MHKHYEMIENEKLRTQTTGKMTVWNFFLLRDVCMAMSNSFISIVRDMFNRKIIFSPLKQHFVEYDFVFFSPCLFYPCQKKGVLSSERKFDNAKDNIIPNAVGPAVSLRNAVF